jgi:hypothetical protein
MLHELGENSGPSAVRKTAQVLVGQEIKNSGVAAVFALAVLHEFGYSYLWVGVLAG